MPSIFPPQVIKEQVHKEFRAAFDELERASAKEKEAAAARLNRAVRRLYDFVGYGKVPQELQSPRGPAYS
jgi:hypothetical protein